MTHPIIEIRNVDFRFNHHGSEILNHISLEIFPNTINTILGPNGSGKTTLLRLMLGLLKPTGGDISICGEFIYPSHIKSSKTPKPPACPKPDSIPIRSHQSDAVKTMDNPLDSAHSGTTCLNGNLKRNISIVPQTEPVSFDLNILEYVLLGRAPHLSLFQLPEENDRRIAREAIDAVGLSHMIHRSVPSLSGGENQLARIARALTQETAVILLDEPTAHLDLANIRKVTRIMHNLVDQGKTIVYTTNDPNIVSMASDRIFMLRDHHIVAAGLPEDVFTADNLSHVYGIDVQVFWQNGRPFVM